MPPIDDDEPITRGDLRALTEAIRSIAHGQTSGPTGLETVAIALAGDGLRGPLGPAIEMLAEHAEALAGHAETIATNLELIAEGVHGIISAMRGEVEAEEAGEDEPAS